YPPLWYYTFAPLFKILAPIFDPSGYGVFSPTSMSYAVSPWVCSPLFLTVVKIPLMLADFITGLVIFGIVKEFSGDSKKAKSTFAFWFLNPIVICISAVHGMYDILPAMMALVAFWLMYKNRPALAGVALGLSILYKAYAVFLIPLYLAYALAAYGKTDGWREKLWRAFKFGIGGLVVAGMFFIPNMLLSKDFVSVFQSRAIGLNVGGLNPWMIVYLGPVGQAIFNFVTNHPASFYYLPAFVSTLAGIAIAYCTYIAIRKNSGDKSKDLRIFLTGNMLAVVMILVSLLVTNPQYIIWMLPFAVAGIALYGWNRKWANEVSWAGVIFDMVVGKLYFFYPLFFWLGLSPESFNRFVKWAFFENTWPKAIPSVIFLIIQGIAALVGFLAFVKFVIQGCKEYRSVISKDDLLHPFRQAKAHPHLEKENGAPRSWVAIFAVVVTILLFASQLYVIAQYPSRGDTGESASAELWAVYDSISSPGLKTMAINYTILSGKYNSEMNVLAVPIAKNVSKILSGKVFIFYDEKYAYVSPTFIGRWIGLIDHINPEMRLRNSSVQISTLDVAGVQSLISGSSGLSPSECTLILPSGSIPCEMYSDGLENIGNWMESGGKIVWIGGEIGAKINLENGWKNILEFGNMSGQEQILGYNLSKRVFMTMPLAFEDTTNSIAFDIRYSGIMEGAVIESVESHGGSILGKKMTGAPVSYDGAQTENVTSLCYIPIGSGGLLYFADGMTDATTMLGEDIVTRDLSIVYLSRIMEASGEPSFQNGILLRKEETRTGQIFLDFDPEKTQAVAFVAFNAEPYSYFMDCETLSLDSL
ncbi:MAG: hypothetical protein PHH26_09075, partial [Candidatus Thermoplasmatota archaeon]|nr:hypothetical protein [Candidatus Thermoplasmatota archaeon]